MGNDGGLGGYSLLWFPTFNKEASFAKKLAAKLVKNMK